MDEELEQALAALTSLIEPVLIIFLGVMIGGMVLAMFLPVFDMVNHVR
jgi:type IV pilus assembly protein PilC